MLFVLQFFVTPREANCYSMYTSQANPETQKFITPVKAILTVDHLHKYLESDICAQQIAFIEALNESVNGLASDADCKISPVRFNSLIFL